ncbi:hypothetical protein JD844_013710 [Phrynosoma platyrhinos]|uniref:SCAN box domain-containing protein n=1 Tax=Phrynosoma platyrhinos TaxID=52577 RepID=A0ABQ7TLI3_PHRPL|nr:hypothetical protein JD844_013710 [Phrynosoma platyrhinos]
MEIAAIQETRITGILDPEIKMEELDSIGPKVEEVKEGATLTKIGSSGGEAGQRVEQEPEEKASSNWHAHFEEFLRTRSAGETLQQPDSKRPQVSAQGVSESNKWPRGLWVSPNQPPLIGGATEDDESHWDAKLPGERKEGTAGKDAVGLELQRQLFRTLSYEKADGPQNLCRELRELCRKWLVPERHTKEQMLELVTLEQFLAVLPLDMQKWLREHVPKSCAQAVTLAEDFLLRHRGVKGSEGQKRMSSVISNSNLNESAGGTGLTGSDEQSPLHEKTEETQQLMTSMKTGKENNFLGHGDPEENRQKANKANGTGKKKVEDQFASSQGGTELTESKEQNPLLESTEETEQLMRSMKTGKQNNFLCQGEPDENRQRTNKYKGNDQEKEQKAVVSS